ncbi:MAG: protein-glutamate O-methyltransferase CheR [Porticoccaceae bacterium]
MSEQAERTLSPPDNSLTLSDRQFRLWADMLESRTGVIVAADREAFFRSQIATRVDELGFDDADAYFHDVLATVAGMGEWSLLLDRLLIKETRFFRHRESHEFIRDTLYQSLQEGRRDLINLWSVGCSTGEETYSLAINAFEAFARARVKPLFAVTGSDVSRSAVKEARDGTYTASHYPNITDHEMVAYFRKLDGRRITVKQAVKQNVSFVINNIFDHNDGFFAGKMDYIFTQNMLIYFKRWRRKEAVNFMIEYLKPGGYLIVGPGELSDWQPPGITRVNYPGVQAYQKPPGNDQ